ncbi:MAG: ribosomal protein S18-alanine N-acetyltransferase [Candidatus Thermoplasmatota archaeon]|nr:ribosomal protein S18-alanine N-acetyltransferase [Candidatus Thermoplasmatota archaeon]MCL5665543.1 ribosomal protein S18-alanine N-acetyltransferase [Candidatus Thermoplasmatota archaeon]
MILRKYVSSDLQNIVDLEKKAFVVGPYDESMIREIMESRNSINLIALDNGRIVGYIVALLLDGSSSDIESIAVDPESSRRGIGTTLLLAMEEQLRVMGVVKSYLEVRENNNEAIRFYIKHGYKTVQFLKNYYTEKFRGSRNAYRMVKILIP